MKFAVLCGMRHNGEPSDVACLIFSSLEKGIEHCKELFGFDPDIMIEGEDNHITAYRWAVEHPGEDYDYVLDKNSVISDVATALYRDYEGYEGNIFAFDLVEVEEAVPFARWVS